MAATKSLTVLLNNSTLTANAANTTSNAVTLDDGYGACLHIKITNGGTGPTVPAQCQIQVSADNSNYYDFGRALVASNANSAVTSWGGIDIPLGVEYLRLVAGSNTVQDVTIRAEISEVIAV